MALKPKHFDWIDVLKAIGIIFVVFGHTVGGDRFFYNYIYSFHVALFFFVSGFLLKQKHLQTDFRSYATKQARALLLPYAVFGVLTYGFWLVVIRPNTSSASSAIHPLKPLAGMFYGTGFNQWLEHNPPLWFLPCLFTTSLIFWVLRRNVSSQRVLVALIGLGAVISYLMTSTLAFRLPWYSEMAFTTLVFYAAGFLLRDWFEHNDAPQVSQPVIISAFTVIVVIHMTAMQFYDRAEIMTGSFGNNVWLFYLTAACGIATWTIFAMYAPKLPIWKLIARHSLVIFVGHLSVFALISGICIFVLKLPSSFNEGQLVTKMAFTTISIGLLIPASMIIGRIAPWAVGGRTTKQPPIRKQSSQPLAPILQQTKSY